MKELKEKAQALIDKYTPELSSKGLKILLSKRYFESNVSERSSGYYAIGTILNSIDRVRDHKEEKENGYNYVKNRYNNAKCIQTNRHIINPSVKFNLRLLYFSQYD